MDRPYCEHRQLGMLHHWTSVCREQRSMFGRFSKRTRRRETAVHCVSPLKALLPLHGQCVASAIDIQTFSSDSARYSLCLLRRRGYSYCRPLNVP